MPTQADKQRPFHEDVIEPVAELLGASMRELDYQVKGNRVYELRLANAVLGAEVVLTVWPSLGRVDARLGDVFMSLKGTGRVTLEPGVEVVFWKEPGPGYLLVTVAGKVSMVG
jgi:hypothetical protein